MYLPKTSERLWRQSIVQCRPGYYNHYYYYWRCPIIIIMIMMMSVPLAVELALRLRDGAARPPRGAQVGARPAAEAVELVCPFEGRCNYHYHHGGDDNDYNNNNDDDDDNGTHHSASAPRPSASLNSANGTSRHLWQRSHCTAQSMSSRVDRRVSRPSERRLGRCNYHHHRHRHHHPHHHHDG